MSMHSLVDDILRSLSHLPTLPQDSTTQFDATASSTRYTRDQHSPSKANNPLSTLAPSASEDAKPLFLTLHFSFPHELLPALDLLDRGLVTRLVPSRNTSTKHPASTPTVPDTGATTSADPVESEVFYVQSASAATSQHHPKHTGAEPQGRFRDALASSSSSKGRRSAAQTTYYEVRLDSWNCSCAAFAFSSFTCLTKSEDEDHPPPIESAYGTAGPLQDEDEEGIADVAAERTAAEWRFGGTLTLPNATAGVPVCKHILAAVMARAAPKLFVDGVHVNVKRELGREEMASWGAGWGD